MKIKFFSEDQVTIDVDDLLIDIIRRECLISKALVDHLRVPYGRFKRSYVANVNGHGYNVLEIAKLNWHRGNLRKLMMRLSRWQTRDLIWLSLGGML